MLKKTDFVKIISDCKESGYEVKVRDVMFCLLKNMVEDSDVIYNSLFGQVDDAKYITNYEKSKPIKFLDKYVKANYKDKSKTSNAPTDDNQIEQMLEDISFEENKAAVVRRINDVVQWMADGEIDKDKGAKLELEYRKVLKEKFGGEKKEDDQRIIVYKNYNDICVCGREIYRPTKEDIMEDLMKEYDLVPKNSQKNTETKQ